MPLQVPGQRNTDNLLSPQLWQDPTGAGLSMGCTWQVLDCTNSLLRCFVLYNCRMFSSIPYLYQMQIAPSQSWEPKTISRHCQMSLGGRGIVENLVENQCTRPKEYLGLSTPSSTPGLPIATSAGIPLTLIKSHHSPLSPNKPPNQNELLAFVPKYMISLFPASVHTGSTQNMWGHLPSRPSTQDGPDIQLSKQGISHLSIRIREVSKLQVSRNRTPKASNLLAEKKKMFT